MIQAIIFDFDGTILDPERAIFDVWQQLFARFGCKLSKSDWLQTMCNQTAFAAIAQFGEFRLMPLPCRYLICQSTA